MSFLFLVLVCEILDDSSRPRPDIQGWRVSPRVSLKTEVSDVPALRAPGPGTSKKCPESVHEVSKKRRL